jgi:hypothetical protein
MQPIDRFYRVQFADSQVLREWSLRVLEVVASMDDVPTRADSRRAVVFVPLKAPRETTAYGYVSEGGRGLASSADKDVTLDPNPVSIRELPDGLGLLLGDRSDTNAYEQRLSDNER